jgi:hypothetical protein
VGLGSPVPLLPIFLAAVARLKRTMGALRAEEDPLDPHARGQERAAIRGTGGVWRSVARLGGPLGAAASTMWDFPVFVGHHEVSSHITTAAGLVVWEKTL